MEQWEILMRTLLQTQKNWLEISRSFVEEDLGLIVNEMTTQIEPHDWMPVFE